MGGNNPLIVKDVSDIDGAVHAIVQSAFITSGQRCLLAPSVCRARRAGDALVKRLVEVVGQIKVGLYDAAEQPFMGAMISEKAALAWSRRKPTCSASVVKACLPSSTWKRAPALSPRAS
jgi:succinylglutamic semialdehyde dehydrogenase